MDREQWAQLKDTIHRLYIDQNLNCKQVAAILREQHDNRVRFEHLSNATDNKRTDIATPYERMGIRKRLTSRASPRLNTMA